VNAFRTPDVRFEGLPSLHPYRCILPDHVGFGRSDEPLDPGWHSLERHVELTASLVEDAGHGIQEDQGPLIGRLVAAWLASRP